MILRVHRTISGANEKEKRGEGHGQEKRGRGTKGEVVRDPIKIKPRNRSQGSPKELTTTAPTQKREDQHGTQPITTSKERQKKRKKKPNRGKNNKKKSVVHTL